MRSFAWDRVLIVERGTPRAAISERLGYEWTGTLGFETGEQLILLGAGKVVRFFDYRGRAASRASTRRSRSCRARRPCSGYATW